MTSPEGSGDIQACPALMARITHLQAPGGATGDDQNLCPRSLGNPKKGISLECRSYLCSNSAHLFLLSPLLQWVFNGGNS